MDDRMTKIRENKRAHVCPHFHRSELTLSEHCGAQMKNLKRPYLRKEWQGKDIHLDIRTESSRFVVAHDILLGWVRDNTKAFETKSWKVNGHYHWPRPSAKMLKLLKQYQKLD